ncbi:agmatine deiminase family protein [Rhodovibrionaceae bacterium A322]
MSSGVNAAELGYRMPAEWEPHERCWMIWPAREEVWEDIYDATKRNYAEVAKAIARFEPLTMVVHPDQVAEAQVQLGEGIDILALPVDDSWARDSGPNFLLNDKGELAATSWTFNAWGQTYEPFDQDALMGRRILDHLDRPCFLSELIAEGGGITVDGEGTVITTESCFLNPNRNPGWSKEEVTEELKRTLGVTKVIWLPGNPLEEETNGHVDGIAAFVRPGLVLMSRNQDDPTDPFAEAYERNIAAMAGQTDAKGRPLELTFIGDANDYDGDERTCLSYINSYLANGAVIMPHYGVPSDDEARAVYAALYPDREIVQVPIHEIATGGGGIHCITQQQPKSR